MAGDEAGIALVPVERRRYCRNARAELELLEELDDELDREELLDDDERELDELELDRDELELDDEDDEELEDELEGELELDEGLPDELDESVGPLTLPSAQPSSIPTPASANPPERSLSNSRRSSRRCRSSLTREGPLSNMDTSMRRQTATAMPYGSEVRQPS
jgi:hypothetical protein